MEDLKKFSTMVKELCCELWSLQDDTNTSAFQTDHCRRHWIAWKIEERMRKKERIKRSSQNVFPKEVFQKKCVQKSEERKERITMVFWQSS